MLYTARVAEMGGPLISPQEVRQAYRAYLAYGLCIWSIARETIVALPVLKTRLRRFAHAADEANSFAALGV